MLSGLNMLQSGLHKQHMKDLFVELCLTVPVRLSSLLPYLPMLMDPLVSALNGSQTLVSQGLRTLELCVDNLQPDFLYDHIQPVRAELMQVGSCSYHHDQYLHHTVQFLQIQKKSNSSPFIRQFSQYYVALVPSSGQQWTWRDLLTNTELGSLTQFHSIVRIDIKCRL